MNSTNLHAYTTYATALANYLCNNKVPLYIQGEFPTEEEEEEEEDTKRSQIGKPLLTLVDVYLFSYTSLMLWYINDLSKIWDRFLHIYWQTVILQWMLLFILYVSVNLIATIN